MSTTLSHKVFKIIPKIFVPVVTILGTFFLCSIVMWATGIDAINAWCVMFKGAVGSSKGFCTTLVKSTPLMIIGTGMAVAFRCSLFSIGADGQMYMGGLFATIIGTMDLQIPVWLHLTIALLAGFIAGAIWAIVPGYLKAKHQTNIIITTILLNYIALHTIDMMVYGPLRADKSSSVSLPESLSVVHRLPSFIPGYRLHVGFLIAMAMVILVYILLFKTAIGIEMRFIGPSPEASRTIGVPLMKRVLLAMTISGGLAGLAGAIEILAVQYKLRSGFVGNLGYTGIAVALLGGNNPLGVLGGSLFFGILRNGSSHMQSKAGIPLAITSVVEGVTILFIVISTAVINGNNHISRWIRKNQFLVAGGVK